MILNYLTGVIGVSLTLTYSIPLWKIEIIYFKIENINTYMLNVFSMRYETTAPKKYLIFIKYLFIHSNYLIVPYNRISSFYSN